MKWFKRSTFLLALTVVLTVGLVACGTDNTPDENQGATDNDEVAESVEITMLSHYAQHKEDELLKYIDQWNEENPDIQVNHKSVHFTELLPTIMAQQTSGQQADINHVYSLWGGQMTKSNVLATPPEDVLTDITENYPDATVAGSTINDQLYGYPTEVQTYALYYNKRLLEEAGYTEPPKTWDELYEIAEATTKKDDSGKIEVAGFGLRYGPEDTGVVHPFLSLLYTAGGTFVGEDGTTVELDSDTGLETLQFQQKFLENGLTDTSIDVAKGFPSENVAMTINASWWPANLMEVMGDDYENIGVAPIPSPDGNEKGSLSYSFMYTVNNQSQHQEEAWEFLKWLNAQELDDGATPTGEFLMWQGIIPPRNSDVEAMEAELDEHHQPFIEAMEYATPEVVSEKGEKINSILTEQIEGVWSGQISAEDALETASDQIANELGG